MTAALRGGAVVFTQWFGSMLQLTPHLLVLMPEAQWTKPLGATSLGEQLGTRPVGTASEAVEVAPPTDDDVEAVLARVLRQAKKDFAEEDATSPEDEYEKGQRESLQRPLSLPTASPPGALPGTGAASDSETSSRGGGARLLAARGHGRARQ